MPMRVRVRFGLGLGLATRPPALRRTANARASSGWSPALASLGQPRPASASLGRLADRQTDRKLVEQTTTDVFRLAGHTGLILAHVPASLSP
eukprot:scaffold50934_cov86-Phaeocystis_antarctica.AAC.2